MVVQKKTIMIVLPWGDYGVAGIEKVMLQLANFLIKEHEIIFFTVSQGLVMRHKKLHEQVIYINAVGRARGVRKDIDKVICKYQPDIILANAPHISLMVWLSRLMVRSKAKIISINHGINKASKVNILQTYLSCILSNKFVAVAEDILYFLKRIKCPKVNKAITIYNGLDIVGIYELANKELAQEDILWKQDYPTVVNVGRLAPQKDIYTLVRAVSEVVYRYGLPVNLLLVGDGDEKAGLMDLVRDLNLDKYIFFLGWKDNPYKYMKHSNLFVLSSQYEGLPTVLIEALACGLPVVSTDCLSGPREILNNGEYGLLVPVGGVAELANNIFLSLNQRYDGVKQCKRAEDFDCDTMFKNYEELILKFL